MMMIVMMMMMMMMVITAADHDDDDDDDDDEDDDDDDGDDYVDDDDRHHNNNDYPKPTNTVYSCLYDHHKRNRLSLSLYGLFWFVVSLIVRLFVHFGQVPNIQPTDCNNNKTNNDDDDDGRVGIHLLCDCI